MNPLFDLTKLLVILFCFRGLVPAGLEFKYVCTISATFSAFARLVCGLNIKLPVYPIKVILGESTCDCGQAIRFCYL